MITEGSKVSVLFCGVQVEGVVDKVTSQGYHIKYKVKDKEWLGLFYEREITEL